ncbi:MAG: flavin prenyltransferase UbiX [Gammaproteobacteria bacterium]
MAAPADTVTLAITGASGVQYGLRLLECLLRADRRVYLLVSKAARVVIGTETELKLPPQTNATADFFAQLYGAKPGQVTVFGDEQWTAPVASGSGAPTRMVICPCSTGTLSALATGACNNLIERAADVALKERRQLLIVPREAPYHEVHLANMLLLTRMGATIVPASPGFYNRPQTVQDMVDFIVARLLDQLGVEQSLQPRWGENA